MGTYGARGNLRARQHRGSNVEAGTGHPVWPVLVPGIHRERAVSVKKPRKGKPDACRGLRVRVQPVWWTNHRPPADYRQEPVPADSAEWIALPRPPRADRTWRCNFGGPGTSAGAAFRGQEPRTSESSASLHAVALEAAPELRRSFGRVRSSYSPCWSACRL